MTTTAQKCPVCEGKGRLPTGTSSSTGIPYAAPCHGCQGKGWVVVPSQSREIWLGPVPIAKVVYQ